MLVVFSAVIVILIFIIFHKNQNSNWEKKVHDEELLKLETLRLNPILNQNFNKAEMLCSLLIREFPGSTIENEIRFKYKIVRTESSQIIAKGYIVDNLFLTTEWYFSIAKETLFLYIKIEDNLRKNKIEKSLNFNKNDDVISIVNLILELKNDFK